MFIGHFGVGFGAKAAAKKISLGTLFIAAQFIDLLWPALLLLGVETVAIEPRTDSVTPLNFTYYPISHSLLMTCIWGAAMGLAYYLVRKNTRGALVLGALVVSHWVLDLIVHRPDLPLYPGSSVMAGMHLWSSLAGTIAVECLIFAAGLALYLRATRAEDKAGRWGLWGLVALLIFIYFMNLFGPPPPDAGMIAWAGHLQWLFVIWAYWVDNHRRPATNR